MVHYLQYDSPLGRMVLKSEAGCLTGVHMGAVPGPDWVYAPEDPVLVHTAQWLDAYFAGLQPELPAPLCPRGTEFQQQVWQRLLQIPYGQVVTYGDLAREFAHRTGRPMSAQVVGGAVGRNPIGILIPCHRVVGAKGQLTGYAGGLDNKAWLLRHEGWKGMRK